VIKIVQVVHEEAGICAGIVYEKETLRDEWRPVQVAPILEWTKYQRYENVMRWLGYTARKRGWTYLII
jgi:hypothetical protein|tara:strand:+ start:424 stop:627 length:204 start_codon:yes stop_codon:yes gene_type:complete